MKTKNKDFLVRRTNTSTGEVQEWRFETETQARDFINTHIPDDTTASRKNQKCEPITQEQINQLESHISLLPTKDLLGDAKTEHSRLLRQMMNQDAILLSECLAVRLQREDGDPARNLLFNSDIDKLRHQIVWAMVDKLDTLLSLIQLAWNGVSEELSYINDAPESGFALFLTIIIEMFDEPFKQALKEDFKISPSNKESLHGGLAKKYYRLGVSLTNKEQIAFNKCAGYDAYWLRLTLDACNQEIKQSQNRAVATKLRDYFSKEGLINDCMHKFYQRLRKEQGDTLSWEEQILRM